MPSFKRQSRQMSPFSDITLEDRSELQKENMNDEKVEPVEVETDEEEYEIEAIVSHKKKGRGIIYTIAWVGYPGETSEVKEEDLAGAAQLLKEYKQKHNLDQLDKTAKKKKSVDPKQSVSSRRANKKIDDDRDSSVLSIDLDVSDNSQASTPINRNHSTRSNNNNLPKSEGRTLRSASRSTLTGTPMKRGVSVSSISSELPQKKARNQSKKGEKQRSALSTTSLRADSHERDTLVSDPVVENVFHYVTIPEKIGLVNGLEVKEVSSLKFKEGEATVKVTYKAPIPQGFQPTDIVNTKIVRYYAPQKLIDLYETLLQ